MYSMTARITRPWFFSLSVALGHMVLMTPHAATRVPNKTCTSGRLLEYAVRVDEPFHFIIAAATPTYPRPQSPPLLARGRRSHRPQLQYLHGETVKRDLDFAEGAADCCAWAAVPSLSTLLFCPHNEKL
ncbi:hypothetical protein BDZ88DRAFT_419854, partial [Geranomyces variabilis]